MKRTAERLVTIEWKQYKLHRVIASTEKDIHHILSRKMANKFNVNHPKNKIEIQRRKHVALNQLFLDHQSPRDQLKNMLDIRRTALSPEVAQMLEDIVNLDDEALYAYELVKKHKLLKDKI